MSRALSQKQRSAALDQIESAIQRRLPKFPDDSAELRRKRRALATISPEACNALYLPHYFRDPPARFHSEIYRAIAEAARLLVIAPRGHSKSTIVSIGYTLHQAVCAPLLASTHDADQADLAWARDALSTGQGLEPLLNTAWRRALVGAPVDERLWYDPYILIGGATEDVAEVFTYAVKRELEDSDRILYDWDEQVEDRGVNYTQFTTLCDVTVRAVGVATQFRGAQLNARRPTLCIIDDPDDKANNRTQSQRDDKEKWLNADIRYGLEPGARVFVVTTRGFTDGLADRLYSSERYASWTRLFYQALLPDGSALWEERWSQEELEANRREDPEAFEAEMMNMPPSGSRPFPALHYYTPGPDWDVLPRTMIVDPSLGRTEKSDFQALITLSGPDKTGRVAVRRAELLRLPVQDLIHRIQEGYREETPELLVMETVGFQALLALAVEVGLAAEGLLPAVTTIDSQTDSKDQRIRSLAPLNRAGRLLFPDDGTCRALELQFTNYPEGKKDGPDAVEMGVRCLRLQAAEGGRDLRHIKGRADLFGRGAW